MAGEAATDHFPLTNVPWSVHSSRESCGLLFRSQWGRGADSPSRFARHAVGWHTGARRCGAAAILHAPRVDGGGSVDSALDIDPRRVLGGAHSPIGCAGNLGRETILPRSATPAHSERDQTKSSGPDSKCALLHQSLCCRCGPVARVPEIGAVQSDVFGEVEATHSWLGKLSLRAPHWLAANSRTGIRNAISLGTNPARCFSAQCCGYRAIYSYAPSNERHDACAVRGTVDRRKEARPVPRSAGENEKSQFHTRSRNYGGGRPPAPRSATSRSSDSGCCPRTLSFGEPCQI